MKNMIIQGLEQSYQNVVRTFAELLPRLAVMLIIILVGLFVALLLKRILRWILRLANLDRLSEQSGASHALRSAALPSTTEFLTRALFWIIWIAFLLLGVSALGIAQWQEQISHIFQLLPQLLIAIVILFVGLLAANFFSRAVLLASVNAGFRSPRVWSACVRFVIWILAISMALEQIGLARRTVITAFSIIFGALMLALAIAFGLGGKELARQTLERYLGDKRQEREKEEEPSPL